MMIAWMEGGRSGGRDPLFRSKRDVGCCRIDLGDRQRQQTAAALPHFDVCRRVRNVVLLGVRVANLSPRQAKFQEKSVCSIARS